MYGTVDSGPADLDVSIGALTSYWTEPASFTTAFNDATSFSPNARTGGNYVKFTGAIPANGEITITARYQGGGPGGLGIAGLQLVSSADFPTNTLPIAINRFRHQGYKERSDKTGGRMVSDSIYSLHSPRPAAKFRGQRVQLAEQFGR